MVTPGTNFWEEKPLEALSSAEWEALCDGCARCCVHKFEDDATGDVVYTNVSCRLLDPDTCRCTQYANRRRLVPECACLSPDNVRTFHWLPPTCAYRRLAAGRPLPAWHPLVTGDRRSTHKAGMSVRQKVVSELDICPEDAEPLSIEFT